MSVLIRDRKEKTGNTAKGHMMMEVAFRVTQLQNQEMLRITGSNQRQERGMEQIFSQSLQRNPPYRRLGFRLLASRSERE